jgi:retron-type reverse transcriptase
MTRIQFIHKYIHIVSIKNLLLAWTDFHKDKKLRKDVLDFEQNLMVNIIDLHNELSNKTYTHSDYYAFNISDPKPRSIHKAKVRDRLLHHAIYRILYPFFDRTFIADSYSCRKDKGVHKALSRFKTFGSRTSKNYTKTVWILKGDIRKCFASVNQAVLMSILKQRIFDADIVWILERVIGSFDSGMTGTGLPLGNLTSQLLINIYLNELDRFVVHKLKPKKYLRYGDDFILFTKDQKEAENFRIKTISFLEKELFLSINTKNTIIVKAYYGIYFLGVDIFPSGRRLRKRVWQKIISNLNFRNFSSYRGLGRKHSNRKKVKEINWRILNILNELW